MALRVLNIPGFLPPPIGGISRYMSYLYPYLCSQEVEVHALLPSSFRVYEKQYAVFEQQGVRIKWGESSRSRCAWIGLALALRHGRHALRHTGLPAYLQVLAHLSPYYEAARSIVREQAIDCIHFYDSPWYLAYLGRLLKEEFGVPFLQTTFGWLTPIEGEDALSRRARKFIDFVRWNLRAADSVCAVTRHCANTARLIGGVDHVELTWYTVGIDDVVHRTISAGTHEQVRNHLNQLGIQPTDPIILSVGHLVPRKCQDVVVRAAAIARYEFPHVRFLLVGPDYGMMVQLQDLIDSLDLAETVYLLGHVEDELLDALYREADLFVFPTCTPLECLGLVFVEAMGRGKLVIGSDIDGIPEVIQHQRTGLLFPPRDHVTLSERISWALTHVDQAEALASAGQAYVEQHFKTADIFQDLMSLYERVVDRATAAGRRQT
jgi:glycosyltransferase involved in cell wall biosynthesis